MDFAKRELMKHGWTEGQGLGKESNGISKPIRIPLKRDLTGVGFDPGAEFTNHWWKTAFHNALDGISVNQFTSDNGGHSDSDDSDDDDTNSCHGYGEGVAFKTDTTRSALSKDDQMLFQACGGRTAHKAARHGLKMGGKLKRLAEQEKLVVHQGRMAAEAGRIVAREGRIAAQEGRIAAEEGRIAAQEVRIAAREGRIAAQEGRIAAEAGRIAAEAGRIAAEEGRIAAQEGRIAAQEERRLSRQMRQGAWKKKRTAKKICWDGGNARGERVSAKKRNLNRCSAAS